MKKCASEFTWHLIQCNVKMAARAKLGRLKSLNMKKRKICRIVRNGGSGWVWWTSARQHCCNGYGSLLFHNSWTLRASFDQTWNMIIVSHRLAKKKYLKNCAYCDDFLLPIIKFIAKTFFWDKVLLTILFFFCRKTATTVMAQILNILYIFLS